MAGSVGIDVSKDTLAVCVRSSQEQFQVTNDAAGHRALIDRIKALEGVQVVQNGLPEIIERQLQGWVHLRP